jgi:hypothetical protein
MSIIKSDPEAVHLELNRIIQTKQKETKTARQTKQTREIDPARPVTEVCRACPVAKAYGVKYDLPCGVWKLLHGELI